MTARDLVIRRNDFSLSENDTSFSNAVGKFLSTASTPEAVRRAEPLGFDAGIWTRMVGMGCLDAVVGAETGGYGSMLQAVLIAEESGRYLAPVPFVETATALRLLARVGPAAGPLESRVRSGGEITGVAADSATVPWPRLIATGAIATSVLGLAGGDLVCLSRPAPVSHVRVLGHLPAGWWSPDDARTGTLLVASEGAREAFAAARDDYRLLTAAALCGLAAASLEVASGFARERSTRGVRIGSLQGVSHPLAEAKVAVEGARQTARKAAWFCDNDRDADPKLPLVAFIAAVRAADLATRTAVHVHGGIGVTVGSAAAMYFLRARAWGAFAGRVADAQLELASVLARDRYLSILYPSML